MIIRCIRAAKAGVKLFMMYAVPFATAIALPMCIHAQQTVATGEENTRAVRHADALLARSVDINVTKVSRRRAITAAAASAKVAIQYRDQTVDAYADLITVRGKGISLRAALDRILVGTTLAVVPDGTTGLMLVERRTDVTRADSTGTLSGIVTDSATRRAIEGASVTVDGSRISAMTEGNGRYVVRGIPVGRQRITIRRLGYTASYAVVQINAGDDTPLSVALSSSATVLSGVVTTATGTQRKVEVGNDITTLNVPEIMRTAPIRSITDLLEARVPGMTVVRSSGAPGDPARIRLRGTSSITGNNDPIVIVDGVRAYAQQSDLRSSNGAKSVYNRERYAAPSPLDQIDPNNIETIEVFKGPSASSLYGSDAANGVIVITTKRGKAGPARWTGTLAQGVNYTPGDWPINYFRFGTGLGTYTPGQLFCAWNDLTCVVDSTVGFQALNDKRYKVFDRGSAQEASTTVSGGSGTLSYSLSGSGQNTLGLMKLPGIEIDRYKKFYGTTPPNWMRRPDRYKTWGVSGQLTAQPNAKATITAFSSLFSSAQQKSSLDLAIGQLQGIYIDPNQLGSTPLVRGFVERVTSDMQTTRNALTANVQPFSWLPLLATVGLDSREGTDESLIPYGINSNAPGIYGNFLGIPDTTGNYSVRHGNSQTKTVTLGASNVPVVPQLLVSAGVNATQTTTSDANASLTELAPGITRPTSFPTTPVNGVSPSSFSQAITKVSTYGWFLEPRLNFNSRFFVSPGFRLDGGSASGSGAGLTSFPKLNFSYIAIDQASPRGIVSLLRPRLAYGYAGTQPAPNAKLRLLRALGDPTNAYPDLVSLDGGATFVPAIYLASLGNTQLRPERSREIEGGFDTELWNGRVSVTYTQYNKTRNDAIISVDLGPSVTAPGAQRTVQRNIGVVRNTGNELTVNLQPIQRRAIAWNLGTTFTHNTNVVVRLNAGQNVLPNYLNGVIQGGDGTRIVAGYPLFGRWARPILAYDDANKNGIIDVNEVRLGDSAVYVGAQDPRYNMNLNTGLTLLNGQLSVNATVSYQNGFTQFNQGAMPGAGTSGFYLLPNAPGTSLATQAAVVAAGGADPTGSLDDIGRSYIGFVQTVSTLRLNAVSVSYTVPRAWSSRFRIPTMNVALQGSNLGLHSNYRGKDPNVNVYSNDYQDRVTDAGGLPQPRTWRLAITLGN